MVAVLEIISPRHYMSVWLWHDASHLAKEPQIAKDDEMTIILRKQRNTLPDLLLALFGKKRAYILTSEAVHNLGPYVYAATSKESFWKGLFRAKGESLPVGLIHEQQIDELLVDQRNHANHEDTK